MDEREKQSEDDTEGIEDSVLRECKAEGEEEDDGIEGEDRGREEREGKVYLVGGERRSSLSGSLHSFAHSTPSFVVCTLSYLHDLSPFLSPHFILHISLLAFFFFSSSTATETPALSSYANGTMREEGRETSGRWEGEHETRERERKLR